MSLLLYLTFIFPVRYILINQNRDYLGCDIVRGKFQQAKFQLIRCFDYICILPTELFSYGRQSTSYFTNKCYILYFILRITDITFLLFYMETGGSTGVSVRNSGKE
jgi:hypothetical protein